MFILDPRSDFFPILDPGGLKSTGSWIRILNTPYNLGILRIILEKGTFLSLFIPENKLELYLLGTWRVESQSSM